jgi:hypothetical protein
VLEDGDEKEFFISFTCPLLINPDPSTIIFQILDKTLRLCQIRGKICFPPPLHCSQSQLTCIMNGKDFGAKKR